MKLKTLKDLQKEKWLGDINKVVSGDLLRKEAIKWVKDLIVRTQENRNPWSAIDIMSKFFKITEEDLK